MLTGKVGIGNFNEGILGHIVTIGTLSRLYSLTQTIFFGIAAFLLSKKKQCVILTLEPGRTFFSAVF